MNNLNEKRAVGDRILQLQQMSKDPYYDQYLSQMLLDMERGTATPAQVSREVERTCRLYQKRVSQGLIPAHSQPQYTPQASTGVQKGLEYKIGAGVLSIVGVLFVLVAFITFGINFMSELGQGICLYAASVLILLLSELWIRRKNSIFALIITGLGIGGLFVSTIINYLFLHTLHAWAAMGIAVLTALLALGLSYKKDSASIRIIGIFGYYLCFFPSRQFESDLEFMVIVGILLIVNVCFLLLPNVKRKNTVTLIHMAANTCFTIILAWMSGCQTTYVILCLITAVIVLNLAYWKQEESTNNIIFYSIELSALGLAIMIAILCNRIGVEGVYYQIVTFLLLSATCGFFFVLNHEKKTRWIQVYFILFMVVMTGLIADYNLETVICLLTAYAGCKLLVGKGEMRVCNAVITGITLFVGMLLADEWYLPFTIVILLSVLCIRDFHLYYEYAITIYLLFATTYWFDTISFLPGGIFLLTGMAILGILLFLFNHLPWMKGKEQVGYNIGSTVGMLCISLVAGSTIFYEINMMAMAAMMILGSIFIILFLTPRYQIGLPIKYFILAVYLCYMVLITDFGIPIITSIMFMLIAVYSVATGFIKKDGILRICGLVLSLLVCVKMALFDFRELNSFYKVILFFVVGIMALTISFVYLHLEKTLHKEQIIAKKESDAGTHL